MRRGDEQPRKGTRSVVYIFCESFVVVAVVETDADPSLFENHYSNTVKSSEAIGVRATAAGREGRKQTAYPWRLCTGTADES